MVEEYEVKVKLVPDTGQLDAALAKISGKAGIPVGVAGGGKGGGVTGGISQLAGATGIPGAGMLSKLITPLGIAAAGIGLTVGILKGIHSSIQKMGKTLEDAAPDFKASKEIQKKIFDQTLRPMASIMTLMMKPYLLLQMRVLKKALKAAKPILAELKAGEITSEEAVSKIMPIFEDAMKGVLILSQDMMKAIGPLIGMMDGFIDGAKVVFNSWLSGIKNYFTGIFRSTLETSLTTIPDILGESITEAALRDVDILGNISPNLKQKYFSWLASDESKSHLAKVAPDTKDEFLANILDQNGLDALKEVPAITAANILKSIFSQPIPTISGLITIFLRDIFDSVIGGIKSIGRGIFSGISNLFGFGKAGDFVVTSGGRVIEADPNDTIIGTKNPEKLGGGRGSIVNNITVNMTGGSGSDARDIGNEIANQIQNALGRRTTY